MQDSIFLIESGAPFFASCLLRIRKIAGRGQMDPGFLLRLQYQNHKMIQIGVCQQAPYLVKHNLTETSIKSYDISPVF